MKNIKLVLTILVSIFLLIGYNLFSSFFKKDKPPFLYEKIVEVEKVKRKNISKRDGFIGIVRSAKQTMLKSKATGTISLIAESGQKVTKGELIAFVKNENLTLSYSFLKEKIEIIRKKLDRSEKLLKLGILSKDLFDEEKSRFLSEQKNLADVANLVDSLNIYAPFDGVLGLFKHKTDSEVGINDEIVVVYQPNAFMVEFSLPLSAAEKVQDGDKIRVEDRQAQIIHVQKVPDKNTSMYPAFAEIFSNDFMIGQTVDIQIDLISKKDVIVIPFEAVFLRNSKNFVYIVKGNKAILTPVTLGIRDKKEVEVQEGLNLDDQLIVNGHNYLYPNQPVKIYN